MASLSSTTAGADGRDERRQVALVGVVALLLAVLVVGGWFNRQFRFPDPTTWERGRLISEAYDPPTDKVGLYLNQGDGQLFATHAQDPFIERPERLSGGPAEQAYRFQRPLYGWMGWMASGGSPGAAGGALVVLTVLSVPLLVIATALTCLRLGWSPVWGLAVVTAPGVLADLLRCGPEILGSALVAVGLGAWLGRPRRVPVAIAAFALAGLARETLLLVPVALFAIEWWLAHRASRAGRGAAPTEKPPLVLLGAAVPYVLWVVVLRVGLGAWPRGSVENRLSLVPFGGLVDAMGAWRSDEWIAFAVIAVTAIAGLVLGRDPVMRLLVAAHVLLAAGLGEAVWLRWLDFGRVLLPLSLVGVLALASRARCEHASPEVAEDGDVAVRVPIASVGRP